jgi:hypothetical protein
MEMSTREMIYIGQKPFFQNKKSAATLTKKGQISSIDILIEC